MPIDNPIRLGVLFGGRSTEHEISIITALQAIGAIDTKKYHITPIYIDLKGHWYTGELLLDKHIYRNWPKALEYLQEVILLPKPHQKGLCSLSSDGQIIPGQQIPIDVYFLAFHGQYGEDGCIQGLLELAGAAYTGCGVLASSLSMNKYRCKAFLKAHGIPVLPGALVSKSDAQREFSKVVDDLSQQEGLQNFPLFVKPCNLGSSIGISAASNRQELEVALAKVFTYDAEALVEPCIQEIMEINVAVIEGNPPLASVVEIPIPSDNVLTYEDKYLRGGKKNASSGMSSLSRVIDPQDLDVKIKEQVTNYALKAFRLLGAAGIARFDFMLDHQENLYFNEINPIPGSFAFYLWEKSRPLQLYPHLFDQMVEGALARKSIRLSLNTQLGFKALK